MRLFIAIDIPLRVQERIRELQARLPKGCSPVRPSQCHCTLKFLGDAGDPERIARELSLIRHPRFEWRLDTLGAFPSLIRPRVVFVEGPRCPALESLALKVDDATKEVRFDKPFRAHVTFARCKVPVDLPALDFQEERFAVEEFVLYQSILRSEGPEYEAIRRFRLS